MAAIAIAVVLVDFRRVWTGTHFYCVPAIPVASAGRSTWASRAKNVDEVTGN